VREPQAMVVMHILDSCAVQPWLAGNNIIDVGTGAGLPGIPLAAINPERQFTLLDSNGKKTRFVTQATAELGLRNVEVVQARIQDYVPPVAFDSILCRAFTSLAEFVKVCDARLAPGGRLLAMKGRLSDDEFAEVPTGWKMDSAVLEVPGLEAERHLIILTRDN
jgi:16S rRNA (guanine527-N7)-methyltransferase